jgi:hypothetical protein
MLGKIWFLADKAAMSSKIVCACLGTGITTSQTHAKNALWDISVTEERSEKAEDQ